MQLFVYETEKSFLLSLQRYKKQTCTSKFLLCCSSAGWKLLPTKAQNRCRMGIVEP